MVESDTVGRGPAPKKTTGCVHVALSRFRHSLPPRHGRAERRGASRISASELPSGAYSQAVGRPCRSRRGKNRPALLSPNPRCVSARRCGLVRASAFSVASSIHCGRTLAVLQRPCTGFSRQERAGGAENDRVLRAIHSSTTRCSMRLTPRLCECPATHLSVRCRGPIPQTAVRQLRPSLARAGPRQAGVPVIVLSLGGGS